MTFPGLKSISMNFWKLSVWPEIIFETFSALPGFQWPQKCDMTPTTVTMNVKQHRIVLHQDSDQATYLELTI